MFRLFAFWTYEIVIWTQFPFPIIALGSWDEVTGQVEYSQLCVVVHLFVGLLGCQIVTEGIDSR